jgi:hypothetical protein
MLIHSYLTNGFVPMAEVFLKSLHKVMGTAAPLVWLDTRSLKDTDMQRLRLCYPEERLHIVNRVIIMEDWARRAGVDVPTLKKYKRQCEQRYVSHKNRVWKLMTAGDDRVQALDDVLWRMQDKPLKELPDWGLPLPAFVAHFDIDTLFRRPLEGLPEMMQQADIWLKLRPGHPTLKARITIDCIFVKGSNAVRKFFDRWRYHINRVPPPQRPVGWGQASCWHAFVEVAERLNYAALPLEYGLPGRNKPDDVIWTGNVHKLEKAACVKLFKKELKHGPYNSAGR